MAKEKRLPDDYDSKGNPIYYEDCYEDVEKDILEPFDPAYLEKEVGEELPIISASEQKYFKKVELLRNSLRVNKLSAEWDAGRDEFIIELPTNSGYPLLISAWVDVEDWTYCIMRKGKKEVDFFSKRIGAVIKQLSKLIK